jgi:enoyl-CoA hydratase/carnithine racemase
MTDKTFTTAFDAARHTTTLTLTKADSGNRLTGSDITAIAGAIRDAGQDEKNKLVVLQAEGEHFCLGRIPDTKGAARPTALEMRNNVANTIMALYATIRNAPIPIVCVVQGDARGFGCAVVAQSDITIASRKALFSLPELDTTIPPTLAMSALLRRVPPKTIAQMVYTRQTITADEARQFGLISQVNEPLELNEAADRIVASLVEKPRGALTTIKEYLWSALYVDATASAHLAQNMISVAMSSF